MRRPLSVQVFVVASQGPALSVLLLRRVARPDLALPDFWQGITGALEDGETFEAAAIREVQEETSIRLDSVTPTGYEYSFPIRPEWRKSYGHGPTHVCERVFVGIVSDACIPVLSSEHSAYRWCSMSQAEELLAFGENRACLNAAWQAVSSLRDA